MKSLPQTLAPTVLCALVWATVVGCGGGAGGRGAASASSPAPGLIEGPAFYCHDLRINLQDRKHIDLSSCAETLGSCEDTRVSLRHGKDGSANVVGTCEPQATAECFTQAEADGHANYFCTRTREHCDLRRIIQGSASPASPCVTAVPTGADQPSDWYCFSHVPNDDAPGPGFPLCFAREQECESIRARLSAGRGALTPCQVNPGAYCVPVEADGRTQLICTASAGECATMRAKMAADGVAHVAACSPARGCDDGAAPCPD